MQISHWKSLFGWVDSSLQAHLIQHFMERLRAQDSSFWTIEKRVYWIVKIKANGTNLKIKPSLFHSNILFYLDGVLFVFKRQPIRDATAPKGKIWRKKSQGLGLTSKGSKNLSAGKRLHLLVAIANNRSVVLAKDYEHMSGECSSDYVETNLSKLFTGETEEKGLVMDP